MECEQCFGDGLCQVCQGEGTVMDDYGLRVSCDHCNATGTCGACRGSGRIEE